MASPDITKEIYNLIYGDIGELNEKLLQNLDVQTKQAAVNNQITLLEDYIKNIYTKDNKISPSHIFQKIKEMVNCCLNAANFFMKLYYMDISMDYLKKSRKIVEENFTQEMKEKNDWKALYVTLMKNYSAFYVQQNDHYKSIHYLKKCVPYQQELEKQLIYLPGAEHTYINLAENHYKIKKYKDSMNYANLAVNLLEAQLNVKRPIPPTKPNKILNEEKIMALQTKKFISLSYAYHLLGKSKSKDPNTSSECIEYYEKAYNIALKHLGSKDKITKGYKESLDWALEKYSKHSRKSSTTPAISKSIINRPESIAIPVIPHNPKFMVNSPTNQILPGYSPNLFSRRATASTNYASHFEKRGLGSTPTVISQQSSMLGTRNKIDSKDITLLQNDILIFDLNGFSTKNSNKNSGGDLSKSMKNNDLPMTLALPETNKNQKIGSINKYRRLSGMLAGSRPQSGKTNSHVASFFSNSNLNVKNQTSLEQEKQKTALVNESKRIRPQSGSSKISQFNINARKYSCGNEMINPCEPANMATPQASTIEQKETNSIAANNSPISVASNFVNFMNSSTKFPFNRKLLEKSLMKTSKHTDSQISAENNNLDSKDKINLEDLGKETNEVDILNNKNSQTRIMPMPLNPMFYLMQRPQSATPKLTMPLPNSDFNNALSLIPQTSSRVYTTKLKTNNLMNIIEKGAMNIIPEKIEPTQVNQQKSAENRLSPAKLTSMKSSQNKGLTPKRRSIKSPIMSIATITNRFGNTIGRHGIKSQSPEKHDSGSVGKENSNAIILGITDDLNANKISEENRIDLLEFEANMDSVKKENIAFIPNTNSKKQLSEALANMLIENAKYNANKEAATELDKKDKTKFRLDFTKLSENKNEKPDKDLSLNVAIPSHRMKTPLELNKKNIADIEESSKDNQFKRNKKLFKNIKSLVQFRELENKCARKIQYAFKKFMSTKQAFNQRPSIKLEDNMNTLLPPNANTAGSSQNDLPLQKSSMLKLFEQIIEFHSEEAQVPRYMFLGLMKPRKNASFELKKQEYNELYLNESMKEKTLIFEEKQEDMNNKKDKEIKIINNKDTKILNDRFSRIETVSAIINSIKKYKIKLYTKIFGKFGLWYLQYHKYTINNGLIHLHFSFNLGYENHIFYIKLLPSIFEKKMFFSTLWPLLESHLEYNFENIKLSKNNTEYNEYHYRRKQNLWLCLPDLNINNPNHTLTKYISKDEQDIIKNTIIKLEYTIKKNFFKMRKICGNVYHYINKNDILYKLQENRFIIYQMRIKIYQYFRKIAVMLPFFNYLYEVQNNGGDVKFNRSEIGIFPNRKYLKRRGINDVSDMSDIENDIALLGQITTRSPAKTNHLYSKKESIDDDNSPLKLDGRIRKKRQKGGNPLMNKNKMLLFQKNRKKPKLSVEELKKREFIEEKIMKGLKIVKASNSENEIINNTLVNPFTQQEILFQALIKVDSCFFISNVRLDFSPEFTGIIDFVKKNIFSIRIDVEKMNGDEYWKDHIEINWLEYYNNVIKQNFKLDIKQFILNQGFSKFQIKLLINNLYKNLTIKESKLRYLHLKNNMNQRIKDKQMNNQISSTKFISREYTKSNFLNYIRKNNLQKVLYIHIYPDFIKTFNNQEENDISNKLVDNDHIKSENIIKVVYPKDIKYGNTEEIVDRINNLNGYESLNHYNTLRVLNNKKYYYRLEFNQDKIFLKIEFIMQNREEYIKITTYSPIDGVINYMFIRDQMTKEKLINILQMDNEKLKEKALNIILKEEIGLIGKKLMIKLNKDVNINNRANKKIELFPENILITLLTTDNDNDLNQYKIIIKKSYLKNKILGLGDCYIQITYYNVFKDMLKYDRIYCIKFEIIPFNTKIKYHKFIINSKDIKYYMNIDYPTNNTKKDMDTILYLINNMYLTRTLIYSKIQIKMYNHISFIHQQYQYLLSNNIRTNIENNISSNNTQNSNNSMNLYDKFLKYNINESNIIIQSIKKLNGFYMIITVEYHKILNYWNIIIYMPKTGRKFITSIHTSDIITINSDILEKLCPNKSLGKNNRDCLKDYAKFTAEYLKQKILDQSNSFHINDERYESEMEAILSQSLLYSNHSVIDTINKNTNRNNNNNNGLLQNSSSSKQHEINSKTGHSTQNHFTFHEMKFWENMIQEIIFKKTKNKHYVLNIHNFYGVIRENLYKNIIKISKTDEALVEVFLENLHRKYDIFEDIPPIPDIYLENHEYFIRITLINKIQSYNNKFYLNQILDLYNTDDDIRYKLPLINKQNKLIFSKANILCKYMIYKINIYDMINVTNKIISKHKTINKDIMLPVLKQEFKLNCNYDIQYKIDNKHKYIDKILIYRGILAIKPVQMVSIVYDETKNNFICYLYDLRYSWLLQKRLKMNEVLSNIPYVNIFLKNKLYNELGRRMYKHFKNSLMIYSYLHKKKLN